MSEKDKSVKIERPSDKAELERAASERQEAIRENVERKAERRGEKSHETSIEESRERAQELAHEAKKQSPESKRVTAEKAEQAPRANTKAARAKAFDTIMTGVQDTLPARSRAFSKVIHNPAVEKASEVAGNTVARPNAILGGSMTAFFVVLAVFLIARHYGYPLSGSETIVAFAAGWLLGIAFDYLRIMITGRRSS